MEAGHGVGICCPTKKQYLTTCSFTFLGQGNRYKWVYKLNFKLDGQIERLKGYHQIEGIDFFKTFSPVIKPLIIRIVPTLTISQKS